MIRDILERLQDGLPVLQDAAKLHVIALVAGREQAAAGDAAKTERCGPALIGFAPRDRSAYMLETRGRDTAADVSIELATKQTKVLAQDRRPTGAAPGAWPVQDIGFVQRQLADQHARTTDPG